MHPRQRRREILRGERRSKQSVQDHNQAENEERKLQESSRMSPAEYRPHAANLHQIKADWLRGVECLVVRSGRQTTLSQPPSVEFPVRPSAGSGESYAPAQPSRRALSDQSSLDI